MVFLSPATGDSTPQEAPTTTVGVRPPSARCLSCRRFAANRVRLQLFVLAYSLGNFLRRLWLPKAINDWSLRSLQVKPIKTRGRIVRHARRFVFQLAEVAVSRDLFAAILGRTTRLCPSPG